MSNQVLNVIVDASRSMVDSGPEYDAWYARYEALEDKLKALPFAVQNEYFHVVWHGCTLRGEAMFKLGWKLRGNPDALFELPEPE